MQTQHCLHDYICDQSYQRGLIHTEFLRHTFHRHLITTPTDQQYMYLILLKVDQSAFTQTSFSSLPDVHECSGGLHMALSSLDKETAGCNSPHEWLMSLAMGLASLCDMWRWKWHQWMPFGCFSEDVAFAHHFVAPCLPPPSHTIGVLVVLATPVKNYLKLWAIQLAIQCTVDIMKYLE